MAKPSAIKPVRLRQKYVNGIFYGDPGIGKTPFIGTAKKALILDADNGTESAAIASSTAEVWPIESHEDLTNAHEYLREEEHDYEWVFLDSATLFMEIGMDDIMEDLIAQKPHLDKDVPSQREYLVNMNRFMKWVRYMKALPINFAMTAHVMRIEDETDDGDEIITYLPAIPGKSRGVPIAQHICGHMNLVGYMKRSKSKKHGDRLIIRTERYGNYYAKDRFTAIGTMANPTIPKMMEKIRPVIEANTKSKSKKKRRKRT